MTRDHNIDRINPFKKPRLDVVEITVLTNLEANILHSLLRKALSSNNRGEKEFFLSHTN